MLRPTSERSNNLPPGRSARALEKRIVCPLQECLPLAGSAIEVHRPAICPYLTAVPRKGSPAFDLSGVDGGKSTTHPVTAIPLKPTARIRTENPAFLTPVRQWHPTFQTKRILARVGVFRLASVFIPICRELALAVSHILAFEHAKFQHLSWRHLGREVGVKVLAWRRNALIAIARLHSVLDDNFHRFPPRIVRQLLTGTLL